MIVILVSIFVHSTDKITRYIVYITINTVIREPDKIQAKRLQTNSRGVSQSLVLFSVQPHNTDTDTDRLNGYVQMKLCAASSFNCIMIEFLFT